MQTDEYEKHAAKYCKKLGVFYSHISLNLSLFLAWRYLAATVGTFVIILTVKYKGTELVKSVHNRDEVVDATLIRTRLTKSSQTRRTHRD